MATTMKPYVKLYNNKGECTNSIDVSGSYLHPTYASTDSDGKPIRKPYPNRAQRKAYANEQRKYKKPTNVKSKHALAPSPVKKMLDNPKLKISWYSELKISNSGIYMNVGGLSKAFRNLKYELTE